MTETEDVLCVLLAGDIIIANERGLKHIPSRLLGRTPWHHIMLYAGDGNVFDVIPTTGCHVTKLNITKERYISYKVLRCKSLHVTETEKIIFGAQTFVGKGFSWCQVFRGLVRRFIPKKSRMHAIYSKKLKSLMCSNFVAMAYNSAGLKITHRYPPEYVMPKDYGTVKGFTCVLEKRFDKSYMRSDIP